MRHRFKRIIGPNLVILKLYGISAMGTLFLVYEYNKETNSLLPPFTAYLGEQKMREVMSEIKNMCQAVAAYRGGFCSTRVFAYQLFNVGDAQLCNFLDSKILLLRSVPKNWSSKNKMYWSIQVETCKPAPYVVSRVNPAVDEMAPVGGLLRNPEAKGRHRLAPHPHPRSPPPLRATHSHLLPQLIRKVNNICIDTIALSHCGALLSQATTLSRPSLPPGRSQQLNNVVLFINIPLGAISRPLPAQHSSLFKEQNTLSPNSLSPGSGGSK
ncbi:hypothetical protein Hypma_008508 [Hypsizygus marmoreus]|uniref:Uncharacterized protein n=1 Tax=Hypsizygus marmoreus TaxID=39966 RepID=A0A369JY83_HYPMA|nr:hypothetical protein Hypma_008508 [Hypsizygus marmoreus]